RDDERAAAEDDLLPRQVGGELPGLRVDHGLALAAGDDERLVGAGDLVATGHQQQEQDEDGDEADHGIEHGAAFRAGGLVGQGWGGRAGGSSAGPTGHTGATDTAVGESTPVTWTSVPASSGTSARALRRTLWPPMTTRTVPRPSAGMAVTTWPLWPRRSPDSIVASLPPSRMSRVSQAANQPKITPTPRPTGIAAIIGSPAPSAPAPP